MHLSFTDYTELNCQLFTRYTVDCELNMEYLVYII